MRKIEREMIRAIRDGKNWRNSNTNVFHGNGYTAVRLHGHLIAERLDLGGWKYNLCGWNTPTTRSRISAIMREFERSRCIGVGTKLGQVEIRFVNEAPQPVESDGWFTVD